MSTMSSRQSPSSAEKRALASTAVNVPGIVVPGIVLTQAGDHDLEAEREFPPPSPQQVVLLTPGIIYPGRKARAMRSIPQTARQLVCVALVALAFWHLWSTLDMGAMHVPITDVTP